MSKSLLLVVDVQNGFINDLTEHVVEPIAQLAGDWLASDKPVVYSRFINLPGSPWQRLRKWDKMTHEPDTLLHDSLPVYNATVLKKGTISAWSDELQQIVNASGIDTIYICGIDTDECVLATAMNIFEANLRPVVITDLCASSRGEEYHGFALKLLESNIGLEQLITKEML